MTRTIQFTRLTDIQDDAFTWWPTDLFHRISALCPSVDAEVSRPVWLDHQNVETDAHGTKRYVCHPYRLYEDAWEDFTALTAAGYRVRITGNSDYMPGRTVRVEVRLPTGGAAA